MTSYSVFNPAAGLLYSVINGPINVVRMYRKNYTR